jgi:NAD(P)-dependent dehydrogenase (short-subunit alcohol dehydrogenase family)
MKSFKDKVIIVTGGASGIGLGLAQQFARDGARVVVSDLNGEAVKATAAEIGAVAMTADVSIEADIKRLVDLTLEQFGRIDLFVSNAGIAFNAGVDAPIEKWEKIYHINVLAHVYAAKYALPSMLARGEGYFLNTASAAGIIVEPTALPYTVSKHAAFGFAEWLAVAYRNRGIRVSVLAPAGVRTPMAADHPELLAHAIGVDEVVEKVVAGLAGEHFLISTHDFVDKLFHLKTQNYDEYICNLAQRREDAEKSIQTAPAAS